MIRIDKVPELNALELWSYIEGVCVLNHFISYFLRSS